MIEAGAVIQHPQGHPVVVAGLKPQQNIQKQPHRLAVSIGIGIGLLKLYRPDGIFEALLKLRRNITLGFIF